MESLPRPKSIELSRKGWAVILPNGDFSIHQYRTGMYISAEDHQKIMEAKEDIDLIGKRHTAAFLRKCRRIDMQDPLRIEFSIITLGFGKCIGHGEINPDMEYESYLNGTTYKLRNIISIVP